MKPPHLPITFRYLSHLGRGGTAEVARVRVEDHGRDAALKYPISHDAESIALFRQLVARERSLIGEIKFPGLVQIIDHPELEPHQLLMELCEGPTLDAVGSTDSVTKVLNIISALAMNLHFLNIKKLVHGDLKPQNVFLPASWREITDGQLFYLKLSDFSLGRRFDEPKETRSGLGTVGYIAPETLTDGVCDHRSDLFALGVIAYQLIVGGHPFIDPNDPDPVRTNSRVCEAELSLPIESQANTNPKVAELILALLHKDPSKRPGSGWEVCTHLASCGATYPYQMAIRPTHLFDSNCAYEEVVAQTLQLAPAERERLGLVTEQNQKNLRMVLSVNFRKGNLTLERDRFQFRGHVYWPDRTRRETLNRYRHATFGERRMIVRVAIAGGREAARRLTESGDHKPSHSDGLYKLILPLLKTSTVRTVSSKLAPRAERLGIYEAATRLYLQAGELVGAERCAFQAAAALNKDYRNDAALDLLQQVIDYALMIGHPFEIRQLLMSRGDIHKETGDADPAMDTYHQLIELYRDQPADKLLAETYKDLGDLYKIKQDPVAGLASLEKAMRIYSDLGDELEISHTLNNIGNLHWVGGDYSAALTSYRRALKIQRRHKAMNDVASSLGNIGSVYFVKGKLVRATRLLRLSIDICRKNANELEEARLLNNLGHLHHMQGMADEALGCLDRSLEINRKIGAKKEILFNLENMIGIMIGTGHLNKAVKYLQEGMALATELDDRSHLAALTGDMGRTLKRMGRYSEAEKHYLKGRSLYGEVEDPIGSARLEIGRADLRHQVGDTPEATRIALETMEQRAVDDVKSQELEALLVLTKISDRREYLDRARELVKELNLERERTIVEFNALNCALRKAGTEVNAGDYSDLLDTLSKMHGDIELPWMNNLAGELMLLNERHFEAAGYLERSLNLAADFGLLPELIGAHALYGRLHLRNGEFEQAFACFRRALDSTREISNGIDNSDDRKLYQNLPTVTFLVAEIKKLAQMLATEKKAGA